MGATHRRGDGDPDRERNTADAFGRYFVVQSFSANEQEVVRYAAILRGSESAWQAISYGLTSITIMAEVGAVYINFALWAVAIFPAWLAIRQIGTSAAPSPEQYGSGDSKDGSGELQPSSVGEVLSPDKA